MRCQFCPTQHCGANVYVAHVFVSHCRTISRRSITEDSLSLLCPLGCGVQGTVVGGRGSRSLAELHQALYSLLDHLCQIHTSESRLSNCPYCLTSLAGMIYWEHLLVHVYGSDSPSPNRRTASLRLRLPFLGPVTRDPMSHELSPMPSLGSSLSSPAPLPVLPPLPCPSPLPSPLLTTSSSSLMPAPGTSLTPHSHLQDTSSSSPPPGTCQIRHPVRCTKPAESDALCCDHLFHPVIHSMTVASSLTIRPTAWRSTTSEVNSNGLARAEASARQLCDPASFLSARRRQKLRHIFKVAHDSLSSAPKIVHSLELHRNTEENLFYTFSSANIPPGCESDWRVTDSFLSVSQEEEQDVFVLDKTSEELIFYVPSKSLVRKHMTDFDAHKFTNCLLFRASHSPDQLQGRKVKEAVRRRTKGEHWAFIGQSYCNMFNCR